MRHSIPHRLRLPGVVLLLFLAGLTACDQTGLPSAGIENTSTLGPTLRPEPLIPTRNSEAIATEPVPELLTDSPTPEPVSSIIPTLTASEKQALSRFGVVGQLEDALSGAAAGIRFAHYAFWSASGELPDVPDVTWWQMVRVGQENRGSEWPGARDEVAAVLKQHPGSFWLVGNEADVQWQDNVTAERYAEQYHDIYTFIKARDPSAQVVAGGIALPTPLRLRYLDTVLTHYQATYGEPLPTDMWHIHTFTLREEADSWGIGIPPGMSETTGLLYEIEDHARIDLFVEHITNFRDWMAANGYSDKPLAITEMGILMPADYGFPIEVVGQYMRDAFDYLQTATGENGLAADGGRLVQYWFWFILYDPVYTTGNLFNIEQMQLTELGEIYQAYLNNLPAQP
jgi:hypothetical protein